MKATSYLASTKTLQAPGKAAILGVVIFVVLVSLLLCTSPDILEANFKPFAWQAQSFTSMITDGPGRASVSKIKESELSSDSMANPDLVDSEVQQAASTNLSWVRFPTISNFTQRFFQDLADNGTKPCHDVSTTRAQLFGLPKPENGEAVRLSTGVIHELVLISYGETGEQRCAGGDYFETDLSGPSWKSRPPTTDLGNGSYSILLQVHPHFSGFYNLKVVLLFANFHDFHQRTQRWFRGEEVVNVQIEFVPIEGVNSNMSINLEPHPEQIRTPAETALELKQCKTEDFQSPAWSGRWTREIFSEDCKANEKGRFVCLDLNETCKGWWCQGPVGALESNGWVYSAHCSFKIFQEEEAWKCLDKKWLFFWGDSNHIDTIRNLLNFVLGFDENITFIPRRFDQTFSRPLNNSQSVRITSMFNGHANMSLNHEGLHSLSDPLFRRQIRYYFAGESVPDFVIMNSGLHDGLYWKSVRQFADDGAANAARFWRSVMREIKVKKPTMIYRTTIATAGQARAFGYNPHKMEIFNRVLVEKLTEFHLLSKIVDGFDLTFPWHFDNNCSDGVHYGKPPAPRLWYGQMGHQYFVDLMLVHILLHAICVE